MTYCIQELVYRPTFFFYQHPVIISSCSATPSLSTHPLHHAQPTDSPTPPPVYSLCLPSPHLAHYTTPHHATPRHIPPSNTCPPPPPHPALDIYLPYIALYMCVFCACAAPHLTSPRLQHRIFSTTALHLINTTFTPAFRTTQVRHVLYNYVVFYILCLCV